MHSPRTTENDAIQWKGKFEQLDQMFLHQMSTALALVLQDQSIGSKKLTMSLMPS